MRKWNEDNITHEVEILIKQYDRFPSAKFLQDLGRWDLFRAIAKSGGFTFYRKKLNFSITERNHWKNNYRTEIEKIVEKLGRFPSQKELKAESQGLFDYLYKTGLLTKLRKQYKYQPQIKPSRYWYDFDNLKKWLLEHFGDMIKAGIFPTSKMLSSVKGGRCIATDVIRRHGGYAHVAKLLKCQLKNKLIAPDGHYLDSKYELIVDWYLWTRNINHNVHGLIAKNKKYKYDFKLDDNLYIEVWGLNNASYQQNRVKKEALYASEGLRLISLEANLFTKSFPKIEEKLNEIFADFGLNIVKENTTYKIEDVVSRGRGYWTFENTLHELKIVVDNIGQFPTVSYLRKIGKYQIQKSMQKYGGQNKFRAFLGFPLLRKQKELHEVQ